MLIVAKTYCKCAALFLQRVIHCYMIAQLGRGRVLHMEKQSNCILQPCHPEVALLDCRMAMSCVLLYLLGIVFHTICVKMSTAVLRQTPAFLLNQLDKGHPGFSWDSSQKLGLQVKLS